MTSVLIFTSTSAGVAGEDSTTEKGLVELPASGTVLEDGFPDLKLKFRLNSLSMFTLNV